jgi:hypothetical protein
MVRALLLDVFFIEHGMVFLVTPSARKRRAFECKSLKIWPRRGTVEASENIETEAFMPAIG